MYRTIHQPHLHYVYRELQLSFISLLSLSLAYVGNILVRRYRPLTPCCGFILYSLTLLCPYFSAHLPCCAFILFSLTPWDGVYGNWARHGRPYVGRPSMV